MITTCDLKINLLASNKVDSKISKKNKNWTKEEDEHLRQVIEKYGTALWSKIASKLANRTGKQCKERWYNVLNPSDENREWLFEEDWLLFLYQRLHRSNWSQITKHFVNRNENVLKTHWNSTMKKKIAAYRQRLQEAIYLKKTNEAKFEEEFPQPQSDIIKEILEQKGAQQDQTLDPAPNVEQKIEESIDRKIPEPKKINLSFLENAESLNQMIELVENNQLDYSQYIDILTILEKSEAFNLKKNGLKDNQSITKHLKFYQRASDEASNEDENMDSVGRNLMKSFGYSKHDAPKMFSFEINKMSHDSNYKSLTKKEDRFQESNFNQETDLTLKGKENAKRGLLSNQVVTEENREEDYFQATDQKTKVQKTQTSNSTFDMQACNFQSPNILLSMKTNTQLRPELPVSLSTKPNINLIPTENPHYGSETGNTVFAGNESLKNAQQPQQSNVPIQFINPTVKSSNPNEMWQLVYMPWMPYYPQYYCYPYPQHLT